MKPVIIDGKPYLLVKSIAEHANDGSCEQCFFDNESGAGCPRSEYNSMLCIDYERETRHISHLIPDTPQERADYIAKLLTS